MFEVYCTRCGQIQDNYYEWRCSACGGPFELHNEAPFKKSVINSIDQSVWRYNQTLYPIDSESKVTLGEGYSPLISLDYPPSNTLVKLEYVSPTGSLKDRGVTLMVSHMRQIGIKKAIEDSSGNAGASVAAYCARASIECEIFVPEKVRSGKATQIIAYGAKLRKVPGSREETTKAAHGAATNTFYASHHWNPYYLHGKETMAFEITEQLNWNAPDFVFIPAGSGSTFYGAIKGFKKLIEADIIENYPKFIGVQSKQCAPIYSRMNGISFDLNGHTDTIADGISIRAPIRLDDILKSMKEVKAEIEIVSDSEIITSLKILGKQGYFVEPTSAVVHAAWKKQLSIGKIDSESKVVLILTGIGLKATATLSPIFQVAI